MSAVARSTVHGMAQLVVERPRRGDHLAQRREHRGQQILGRRLARRPGDADDRQPARHQLGGHRGGQLGQRGQHRRTRAVGVVLEHAGAACRLRRGCGRDDDRGHADRSRGQHRDRTGRHRGRREVVAVGPRAGQRQEQPAGSDRARVEFDGAGDAESPRRRRPRCRRARRRRCRRSGRAVRSITRVTPAPRARRPVRRGRRTAGSARGCVCPASWPLPAISTTSPARGPGDRVVDGRAPVADLDDLARRPASAAPARIAARIAAGSSSRGLSSVTTTRSASSAATRAHRLALAGSRLPPAPNTTASRPVGLLAQRLAAPRAARPACARSRPARGSPGRGRSARSRPGTRASRSPGAACSGDTPTASRSASRQQGSWRRCSGRAAAMPQPVVHAGGIDGDELLAAAPDGAHVLDAPVGGASVALTVTGSPARSAIARPASSSTHTTDSGGVRRRSGIEQPRLGVEVVLHRRVEVEVVARQVGEPADREARRRRPGRGSARGWTPPSPRCRRRCSSHHRQQRLQVGRLRRGQRAGHVVAVDPDADGADQARDPPGGAQTASTR